MFSLFRLTFWLAIVVAFIPVREADLEPGQRAISAGDIIGIAKTVGSDLAAFCARNDETCTTASMLLSQMGLKVEESARIAYRFVDERPGDPSDDG